MCLESPLYDHGKGLYALVWLRSVGTSVMLASTWNFSATTIDDGRIESPFKTMSPLKSMMPCLCISPKSTVDAKSSTVPPSQ